METKAPNIPVATPIAKVIVTNVVGLVCDDFIDKTWETKYIIFPIHGSSIVHSAFK